MSYRVVYRDPKNGDTYSAPVVRRGDQWMMQTNEGLQQIRYIFRHDRAGELFFDCYREDQPSPPVGADARLHVEPGRDSFTQLQNAGAEATAENEMQRLRDRRQILDTLNQPNARKIAEARAHATALAQRWSRNRPEPIPPTQLTQEQVQKLVPMAEEHRWHRPKKEQ